MKTKILAVAVVGIAVTAVSGLMYLRMHGLSARAKPNAIEEWAARRVRGLATPSSVRGALNPVSVSELIIAEARDHFADHCATCHGNRGDGKTMLGGGMYPPPPDLRKPATQSLTDGEIMNVIREGVRFTGMPGFGGSDDDNWKLTHFIRHLPKLTDAEIALMNEVNHLEGAPNENHH